MPERKVNARVDRQAKRKKLGLKYGSVLPLGNLWYNKQITGGLLPSEIRESRNLSPGAKVMFSALAEWEATQATVYPSIKRLGLDTGFSEKQARRYVQELEEVGLIRVERNKDAARPGLNLPNRYVFLTHPVYDNPPAFMTDSSGAESDLLPDTSAKYSQTAVKDTPKSGSQVTPFSNIKQKQERFDRVFNLRQEEQAKFGPIDWNFDQINWTPAVSKKAERSNRRIGSGELIHTHHPIDDLKIDAQEDATFRQWIAVDFIRDDEASPQFRLLLKAELTHQGVTIDHLSSLLTDADIRKAVRELGGPQRGQAIVYLAQNFQSWYGTVTDVSSEMPHHSETRRAMTS